MASFAPNNHTMYQEAYHQGSLENYSFLITGGAGFIGSNLVEYLLKHNAKKVRVLDNLATGFKHNIETFESNPNFEFILGDIRDLETWFIVSEFPKQAKIIRAAREINNYKTEWAIEKTKSTALQFKLDNGRDAKIACMGLAFKPNIDDLRESPALLVTNTLIKEGFDVLAVEPNIKSHNAFAIYEVEEALAQADIIVYLVAHKEFSRLEKTSNTLDFCGVFK